MAETKKLVKYLVIREGDEGYSVDRFTTKEELEKHLKQITGYTSANQIEVYEVEPQAVIVSIVPKITLPDNGEENA